MRDARSASGTPALSQSIFDHGANRRAGSEFGNLRDGTEARALANRHFAGVGFHAAGKNFEQRGFAGAVRADQADAIAFGNGEGNILKKRRGSVSLGKSLCADDGRQMIRSSPEISLTLRIPAAANWRRRFS